MPVLDSTDYERFSYDEPNGPGLTLDEAVTKAKELRRTDQSNFYRIEVADQDASAFRIRKVPVSMAYAEFVARMAKTLARYSRTPKKI